MNGLEKEPPMVLGFGRPLLMENGYHREFCICKACYIKKQKALADEQAKGENLGHGSVYVLSNRAFPDLLKIGQTSYSAFDRARQLSLQTGVPADFEVEFAWLVTDRRAWEKAIHEILSAYRFNRQKEFFKCDLATAKSAFYQASALTDLEYGCFL